MSSEIIKMDYAKMEQMAQAFAQAGETLETAISEVNAIAQMLADGALLGRAGTAFEEACRNRLAPAMQRLREKTTELRSDILAAMQNMQQADQDTTRFYS